MDAVTTALFWATIATWAAFEVSLIVRDRVRGKGSTGQDAGTRMLLRAVLYVTFVVAGLAPTKVASLRIPGDGWITGAGVAVMWLGLFIRVWAVVSLGPAFRTTVEVDTGQTVVRSGPYRWVRHPSYTGLLLVLTGFGLGLDNWLSLAVCAVLPALALLRRIKVEEDELTRVLAAEYDTYRMETKRLVPLLW